MRANVAEGCLMVRDSCEPVYKTFFSELTNDEIMSRVKESLHYVDIEVSVSSSERWKIVGKSLDGIQITTIVDKSGNVITFFPSSDKSMNQIKCLVLETKWKLMAARNESAMIKQSVKRVDPL